jgi:hypothetical protein
MKIISPLTAILALAFLLVACSNTNPEAASEWEVFGEEISPAGYTTLSEVIDDFEMDTEKEYKISGTLSAVCQEKGCWTILKTDDGREMRMTFKNYSFFLPTDYAGRTAVAEGVGFKKVTSVDELRHYAEDANKPAEEILAIMEPKTEYLFEARGVLIRKSDI